MTVKLHFISNIYAKMYYCAVKGCANILSTNTNNPPLIRLQPLTCDVCKMVNRSLKTVVVYTELLF